MVHRIYQVKIKVHTELKEIFEKWLRVHMADMESLPCFTGSELLELQGAEVSSCVLLARYFYSSPGDIENYFKNYAEKMRGELPEVLKDQICFERALVEESPL